MTKLFIFDPSYIRRTSSRVDYLGIGFLAIGIGALQVVLDKGQQEDWFSSHWITTLSIISAVALSIFIFYELLTKIPVVNLKVLKIPTFSTVIFLMTVLGLVLYGSLVLLPILLQTLLGYPALEAGIAMFPRGLGSFIAMPLVGMIISMVDPRKLLVLGMVGASFTLFQLSWLNLNAGYWDIFWPQLIQGVSLALLFVPLNTVAMDPIPKEEMGNAASIYNLMRNIGGSFGIAGATTMLARDWQKNINILGAHVNAFNLQSQMMLENPRKGFMAQGVDMYTATQKAYSALFGIVERQASMLSFSHTFSVLGIIFLLVIPLTLLLKRPKQRGDGMHKY